MFSTLLQGNECGHVLLVQDLQAAVTEKLQLVNSCIVSPGSSKKSKMSFVSATNTRLPKHLLYTMQNTLSIWWNLLKTITKKSSSSLRQPENRETRNLVTRFPQPACSQEAGMQVWSQTQFSVLQLNWFLQILHYLTRAVNMHDSSASP